MRSFKLSPLSAAARNWARASVLGAFPALVLAGPVQDTGSPAINASVGQSGDITTVTQGSGAAAVVNWNSFDVSASETVNFIQTADQWLLNRINAGGTGSASQIDGTVTAGGNVVFLNPRGVMLGNGASVDVGSLTLSTLNVDDAAFTRFATGEDNLLFSPFTDGGTPIVDGEIFTDYGSLIAAGREVILIAPRIDTAGDIRAGSDLLMLSANEVQLMPAGSSGMIGYELRQATTDTNSGIDHEGFAQATRRIVMAAQRGETLSGLAINQQGSVEATGIASGPNGEIILTATGGDIALGSEFGYSSTRVGDIEESTPSRTGGGIFIDTTDDVQLQGFIDTYGSDAEFRVRAGGDVYSYGYYLEASSDAPTALSSLSTGGGQSTFITHNGPGGIIDIQGADLDLFPVALQNGTSPFNPEVDNRGRTLLSANDGDIRVGAIRGHDSQVFVGDCWPCWRARCLRKRTRPTTRFCRIASRLAR